MKKIIILLLALLPALTMKAQMLVVHTDVAALALQTYNLGAEMNINNRSTLNLDVMHTDNPYWAGECDRYYYRSAGTKILFWRTSYVSPLYGRKPIGCKL